ncbi:uncharacterized protein ASPGLDRAFT_39117 [Aspergillus glaucus CBS 516.65]|uniref:Uncharacterized protein n=1 Tax=Aspergillus glaucus CBS 516.65 TaxID=1160497 RepID=A0A1L9V924_ASPGL|nr:hypothetical protein ASPGLDRAFT_39117 [Aspergillus glaucus CBS 516.65]OJJ80428.1 hypothetical protein ASPGLDRAFT_39117 [Aspergillus glaucus CBS 516.65]
MITIPQPRTSRNQFPGIVLGLASGILLTSTLSQINNNYQIAWKPANIHSIVYLVNDEASASTDGGIVIQDQEATGGQPNSGRSQ